ncbi:MAG: S8 family peptidase, partial [Gammaproteobacteria bacterium]|nr:S8 family peptidase [Gammaproteobacteria bacterium]
MRVDDNYNADGGSLNSWSLEISVDDTTTTTPPPTAPVSGDLVNADILHDQGIKGTGITVAILDTGLWNKSSIIDNSNGNRVLAEYDVSLNHPDYDDEKYEVDIGDPNGHGTHITSIILGHEILQNGDWQGIAPEVNLVAVKAFNEHGASSYIDVIAALDWIVSHKDAYDIRVVNLSFSATPQSFYWEDPLNQAVMAAWQSGIVVVAAAGNSGPDPMTIGVPGNVPYIITVGAMTDNYTPEDLSDDVVTSFSSAGPTHERFVKPDVVAPGGHMVGMMPYSSRIPMQHPNFRLSNNSKYYEMSGTSQSAAVVSGIVALMLEADPTLTPDDVKCRLMYTARPAVDANGDLAASIFQQGAGLVNAYDAVNSTVSGCANQGLDIANDLDPNATGHYVGSVEWDDT